MPASDGAVRFTVPLRAAPQGSKSRGRFGQMYEASKRVRPYRDALKVYALEAMRGKKMLTGPVVLYVTFRFVRAKSNGALLPTSRKIGDLSKLIRATEDALTGIVYKDDSQICSLSAMKQYSLRDEVEISVEVAE